MPIVHGSVWEGFGQKNAKTVIQIFSIEGVTDQGLVPEIFGLHFCPTIQPFK